MAFPGGKQDGDETETETCLREAHEEIGLEAADVEIIAPIPPRISRHNIVVSPVIGLVSPHFRPTVNTSEVEVAFKLPLSRFLTVQGHRTVESSFRGRSFKLPFFDDDVDGRVICTWGLTAVVCIELAIGMFERLPEFEFNAIPFGEQGVFTNDPFHHQVKYIADLEHRLLHHAKL